LEFQAALPGPAAGMVSTGTYPASVPFGGMGKPVNTNGVLRPLSNRDEAD
jgi:hypothetical protein